MQPETAASATEVEELDLRDPQPVLEVRFDFSPVDLQMLGAPIAPEQVELMSPDSQGLPVMFLVPYRIFRGNRYGTSEILHQAYGVRPVLIPAVGTIDWSLLHHASQHYGDGWKRLPSIPVLEFGWGAPKIVRCWDAFPIIEGDQHDLYLWIYEAIQESDLFPWQRFSDYNRKRFDHESGDYFGEDDEDPDTLPECRVYIDQYGGEVADHEHGTQVNQIRMHTGFPTRKTQVNDPDEGIVIREWEEPICKTAQQEIDQVSDYLFAVANDGGYPTWAAVDRDYPLRLDSYQGTFDALRRISRITWGHVPLLIPPHEREKFMWNEYYEETNPWA